MLSSSSLLCVVSPGGGVDLDFRVVFGVEFFRLCLFFGVAVEHYDSGFKTSSVII